MTGAWEVEVELMKHSRLNLVQLRTTILWGPRAIQIQKPCFEQIKISFQ